MPVLKNGETDQFEFVVKDSDGALADADSAPSATEIVNGSSTGTSVSVNGHGAGTTGVYDISYSVSGTAGDILQVRVTATIGGTSTGATFNRGIVDSKRFEDLNDLAQSDILSDATSFAGGNIDAAISSRSDFDETSDPVELLGTGGSAGKNAEEIVDDVWDEVLNGSTHNVASSAGKRLRKAENILIIRGDETAQSGGSNTITLDANASSVDDFYKFTIIVLTNGTGVGQSRLLIGYDGTTKQATVGRDWAINPDNTTEFSIAALTDGQIDEVISRVTANTDQIEGSDATDQIRDSILDDSTRFSGADIDKALSTLESNIRGSDNDTLKNISDEIGSLNDPTTTAIRDAILDRDIVANHNQADSLALLIEVLAADIEDRSNNASLNAILGVADSAGSNLEGNIRGADDDDLKAISDQVDGIGGAVVASSTVDDANNTPAKDNFDTGLTDPDDFWEDLTILFTSGANDGQARDIVKYENENGKITLHKDLDSAPSDGDEFDILGRIAPIARG